jgi:hypothetical protein
MSSNAPAWRIEGEYFESCNCELLCPCLLSQAQARPTEGHCDVVVAFQIRSGSFGNTDLAGLCAVLTMYAPGPMAKGNWTLAPYIDQRATAAQRTALEAIFTGAAGGPMGLFAPLVSRKIAAKAVPIAFSMSGNTRKLSIPGIAEVTVEGVRGAGDNVWLDNVAHFAARRLAAARATSSTFSDQGFKFDNSGRNGHFAPISWSNS